MKKHNKNRGFTIIELLVVFALIATMSAIVISSLQVLRDRGRDSAIKSQMIQFVSLANLHYNDSGSYCGLQTGWVTGNNSCSAFTGNYASQAAKICQVIYNNSNQFWGSGYGFYSGTTAGCDKTFSFMAPLSNGKWYCIGSSGNKGEYSTYDGEPGCYNNP